MTPIERLMAEHRTIESVMDALDAYVAPGNAAQPQAVATNAHAFTALLRAHIQKEDQILYPMALSHLPEDTLEQMSQRFDAFEAGRTRPHAP